VARARTGGVSRAGPVDERAVDDRAVDGRPPGRSTVAPGTVIR